MVRKRRPVPGGRLPIAEGNPGNLQHQAARRRSRKKACSRSAMRAVCRPVSAVAAGRGRGSCGPWRGRIRAIRRRCRSTARPVRPEAPVGEQVGRFLQEAGVDEAEPPPPVPISSCMRTTWPMNSLLWAAPLPVSSFSMALASQRNAAHADDRQRGVEHDAGGLLDGRQNLRPVRHVRHRPGNRAGPWAPGRPLANRARCRSAGAQVTVVSATGSESR